MILSDLAPHTRVPVHRRALVLMLLCGLLVASSAWSAHEVLAAHGLHGHCDLCMHLGSAAAPPPLILAAPRFAALVEPARIRVDPAALPHDPQLAHRPRGPPARLS